NNKSGHRWPPATGGGGAAVGAASAARAHLYAEHDKTPIVLVDDQLAQTHHSKLRDEDDSAKALQLAFADTLLQIEMASCRTNITPPVVLRRGLTPVQPCLGPGADSVQSAIAALRGHQSVHPFFVLFAPG